MKHKNLLFVMVLVISLILTSCGSESNDVPSLAATPIPDTVDDIRDNEALMMEFTECLRNEGLEVVDPKVDADGNIEKPETVDGAMIPKVEWIAAWEVCGEIIENFTFEQKEVDRSAQLDQYVGLATCMQDAGFDIEEPTAETIDTWMDDLKNTFDWDDPDAAEAINTCFGGGSEDDSGKGFGRGK